MQYFVNDLLTRLHPHLKCLVRFLLASIIFNYYHLMSFDLLDTFLI